MGWGRGSEILEDVWADVRAYIPEEKRQEVLSKLCDTFWRHDCDTLEEIETPLWPEVMPALRQIGYLEDDDLL